MVTQVSSFSTQWNLLQFPTMPGWIGPGVATPLPGVVLLVVVVVVVVVGGVEIGGVVLVELELELELELVIGALVDADVVDGAGSNTASTQYECPTASVPQVSGMDGF